MKIINKYSFLLIVFGFLFINFWFYRQAYWKEIIFDSSKLGVSIGETSASEWGMEKIYQKIIQKENPFSPIKDVLHPFGMDIAFSDPGMAFHFLLFRPFFSPHQSLSLYIILTTFLANLGMFLLLRKLNFNNSISFLIGLSYGFMTFLLPRAGHLGYIASIFLFPWFYFFLIKFIKSNNSNIKIFLTAGATLFFVLTLWMNVYYFIILLLSIFFLLSYYSIFKKKDLTKYILINIKYIILGIFLIFILLIPQLIILYETALFSEPPNPIGWAGAIDFSADLFSFFVPSIYNYYYGNLVIFLIKDIKFAKSIFENFTYPGLIILSSLFFLTIFFRKISKKLKQDIKPFLWSSIGFLILTLGPFLHIAGRWWVEVENIKVVLPLPFIILHYLPFLGNIRAPGRLIMGFIFFAYIVSAYVIAEFLKNKSSRFKSLFFIVILAVIIIDQRPTVVPLELIKSSPTNIFNFIKKDNSNTSLLEIPFSIRDGFTYFGDYNSVTMTNGQLVHNKAIVGGYTGRIPDYIKEYYRQNTFLGYLGRVIDENILSNPYMKNTDLREWKEIDTQNSLKAIDFLDIQYIVMNEKRTFSKKIISILNDLGYYKIMNEDKFSLWTIKLDKREFLQVDIGKKGDELFLGLGWYAKEDIFRWVNSRSSAMFKVFKPSKYSLHFKTATFHEDQPVTIYLNKKKVAKINISTAMREYSVPLDVKFEVGINTVYFIFDKYYLPSDVIPGSLDERRLSAKFSKIWLVEQK